MHNGNMPRILHLNSNCELSQAKPIKYLVAEISSKLNKDLYILGTTKPVFY